MLDLNHLKLFVEIVKVGSFAGAARRLGVPTNTVTRHIQQLEAAARVRLIHRSTRKLTLTPAGQALYDRCAASGEELSNAAKETRLILHPGLYELHIGSANGGRSLRP